MSYATIETVKGRAGRLADAWDANTQPGDADLEIYLSDTAAEMDAMIGGYGFQVPVVDTTASASLAGWNADKALLIALAATWPGGGGNQAVTDAIKATQARLTAYETALAAGGLSAIVYLRAQEAQGASGVANFWDSERDYSPWLDDIQSGTFVDYGGGLLIRGPLGPEFHKNWTRF